MVINMHDALAFYSVDVSDVNEMQSLNSTSVKRQISTIHMFCFIMLLFSYKHLTLRFNPLVF